jgi:hypothetical protein
MKNTWTMSISMRSESVANEEKFFKPLTNSKKKLTTILKFFLRTLTFWVNLTTNITGKKDLFLEAVVLLQLLVLLLVLLLLLLSA